MGSVLDFINSINKQIGIQLPADWQKLSELEITRKFLSGVNEYFFQTDDSIGTATFEDEQFNYFSEFHKFWETNHAEILNARIDPEKTKAAANCLQAAVSKYGKEILNVNVETLGLAPEAIAQVRFLSANQDFREPPEDQFQSYLDDPTQFEAETIFEQPGTFLNFFGTTKLSQTEKRLDFARNAARFLIDRKIRAFEIAACFGNNAAEIRTALIDAPNMGYGAKKANMFIRDMVELGVWPGLSHYDEIDVASDINTMKVALRAGILVTDIPLVSSFLDIFCWQYSYIDEMSALAWRNVWNEWQSAKQSNAPRSPCVMDFLLYRIGREHCEDILVKYRCENGHEFYHFGARLKNCKICAQKKVRSPAKPVSRLLPCQVFANELPRENGKLLFSDAKLLSTFDGVCIFEGACQPKSPGFTVFDPPKSISIKGKTSWTNSYAEKKRGGGGMMG